MASLDGSLFTYFNKHGLVAFESAVAQDAEALGYLIFLGGLGDGLMAVSYITELVETLTPKGYAIIQPILRSSYGQYGTASLTQDAEDVDELIAALLERFRGDHGDRKPAFVLLGHSTGCQDIIVYLKHGKHASLVSAAILQGAVSDREYMSTLPEADAHLAAAKQMVASGKGRELMPRDSWGVPITAERYLSLAGRLTPDDLFSSDFTDDELETLFAHVNIPTLWVWSMKDEYVPESVDKRKHGERLEWAVKCDSEVIFVEGANHALGGHSAEFCQEVHNFIMNRQQIFAHTGDDDAHKRVHTVCALEEPLSDDVSNELAHKRAKDTN